MQPRLPVYILISMPGLLVPPPPPLGDPSWSLGLAPEPGPPLRFQLRQPRASGLLAPSVGR